jgi:hypothetical protein
MPSRVIRGEINSSDSLSRVSIEADLTFRALIVAVDDFGRMDARPVMLKAALFPMRPAITAEQILAWITELDAEGCVHLYEVAGRPYLALPSWEEHRGKARRATKSRFPAPPPQKSSDPQDPQDPQGIRPGLGLGDEGRGTRDEKDSAAPAAPRSISSPEGKETRKTPRRTLFPEPFPPELRAELLRWAPNAGFTEAQVDFAIQTVGDWAVSNGKTKASWARTIQGAMRSGWAVGKRPGEPVKQEATRREYLEFDSPAWKRAHGYE